MTRPALQYERVKEYILAGIHRGQWAEGTKIPSENELATQFSLSRMTANRAIRELAEMGVLDRVQGKGTFVSAPRPLQSVLKIHGINQEILARGNRYSCRLLAQEAAKVDAKLVEQMDLPIGSEVWTSTLLHMENDIPVQLEQRWVNPFVAPHYLKQDFSQMTPHDYLMKQSPLTRGEHTIEACIPDTKTRRWLKMDAGEACLRIHRQTWTHQTIASYAKLSHPGSRYQLKT